MNRIFLITKGNHGKKVQETIQKYGEKNVLDQIWKVREDLPSIVEKDDISLPDFDSCDLILSYALHPDINLLVIDALESSEKVLLMPYEKAPLRPGYYRYDAFLVGILKPCCVVPPFKNRILSAFQEEFGTPSFAIQTENTKITNVTVERHTRCGAADFIAENLVEVSVEEAHLKAGLLAQYYCQSSKGPSGSIHDAGMVHAEAVRRALHPEKGLM